MIQKEDLIIRVAGESGDGSNATGEMLAQAAARSGLHVFTFRTTPAEIKGGPVMFQVRASNNPVRSMGDAVDVLFAFNQEAWDLNHEALAHHSVLLFDPEEFTPPESYTGPAYPVPIGTIAVEAGNRRGKNVVAMGVVAAMFGLGLSRLEAIVRAKLGKKVEYLESNLAALQAGIDYAHSLQRVDNLWLDSTAEHERYVMTGNQAIVAGALHAGVGFFAGYPITPASDIMEGLASTLPKLGGGYLQAEDEIASIMACVGASYAGKKAMTATSGPGLALMGEALGLASMAEIPLVVVDAQRGGPSTGLPTKTEQSDLNIAVYGGHGDSPRIVLAPASVAECFHLSAWAFNLAEEYQSPVILLSDYSLSFRTETIEPFDLAKYPVLNRAQPEGDLQPKEYQRYHINGSFVSPMALPGTLNANYTATGLEHNEFGSPAYTPENHVMMSEKRWRKYDALRSSRAYVRRFGDPIAKVGIICWGTTAGAARGAIHLARQEELPLAMLQVQMISPLPVDAIQEFIDSVEVVLVPEVNYLGQFAKLIQGEMGVRVISFTRFAGMPFSRLDILRKVHELMGIAEPVID
ncbi:2-oxoacid:acceptor oxidoreductase subunit alpha [Oscillochloris sp. ZM17-4]|uniref:2-oxoacid:acceptor oxidoreductase subunit alpha n=1 Tax=Oscillochloris sp. ZM17-4 TaxID=2866714 RepID=UPI001C731B9A|nr:2-oxoacid:acceptor oxidoreductase subunit alpha [Oscillochloris sp. ZM17-4]MBX0330341.1 2-oxoacid:acceptor oxidoreductase subunit alpha [Oscillochloris sp. ZM17-4]